MAAVLLPDVERVVALELRARVELADAGLTGDRVYTVTPSNVGADPFVLVRRVGGPPAVGRPLVLDEAGLQVDAYGGTKRAAHAIARAVQLVLSELEGPVDDGEFVGYVTGTRLGPMRYLPDESFEPARSRYVLDVDVFVKRGAASPASGRRATVAAEVAAVPAAEHVP